MGSPSERPARLPRAAIRVVQRSRILGAGIKLTWTRDYALDVGPEGSWATHAQLADMLGMEAKTVEAYRGFLVRAGLQVTDGAGRATRRYCTLPAAAVPGMRPKPVEITRCGQALDAHLHARAGPPTPDHDRRLDARNPRSSSEVHPQETPDPDRGLAPAMGGVGGGTPRASEVETPSSSPVREGGETRRVSLTPEADEEHEEAGATESAVESFSADWRKRLGGPR